MEKDGCDQRSVKFRPRRWNVFFNRVMSLGTNSKKSLVGRDTSGYLLFLISASTAKPPLGSRVALRATLGVTWYCPWMVWP